MNPSFAVAHRNQNLNERLLSAAKKGRINILEQLLAIGGLDLNYRDEEGLTAMHYASSFGNLQVVDKLADAGADVNARCILGITPLMLASSSGHVTVVRRLLSESCCDINAQCRRGWTSLHCASYTGEIEVVKVLLGHKNIDAFRATSSGKMATDVALRFGNTKVLDLIKEYCTLHQPGFGWAEQKEFHSQETDKDQDPAAIRRRLLMTWERVNTRATAKSCRADMAENRSDMFNESRNVPIVSCSNPSKIPWFSCHSKRRKNSNATEIDGLEMFARNPYRRAYYSSDEEEGDDQGIDTNESSKTFMDTATLIAHLTDNSEQNPAVLERQIREMRAMLQILQSRNHALGLNNSSTLKNSLMTSADSTVSCDPDSETRPIKIRRLPMRKRFGGRPKTTHMQHHGIVRKV